MITINAPNFIRLISINLGQKMLQFLLAIVSRKNFERDEKPSLTH
jgi:hypothetical protein